MSAVTVESAAHQPVLQSDKPLEFQGKGELGVVHSVPPSPSVTARFGTYLVPSPELAVRLLTVKDLAARWAVCTATIYSLAKSGKLESLRIGKSIRFMATAVADYEQTRIDDVGTD